jgi:hypothetical protein
MTSLLAIAGLVTAMLAALAGLGKASVWLVRWMLKLARLADDWVGEEPRPGLPDGRPGVLSRLDLLKYEAAAARAETGAELAALRERVAAIEMQLHANGGNSLRDAVDRLASPDGITAMASSQSSEGK